MSPVVLIVPVKHLDDAKSRLGMSVRRRAAIALGLMRHSVSVALSCQSVVEVLVVTSDPRVTRAAQRLGATVVQEPRRRGLNIAIEHARERARVLVPGYDLAVMVSDLPTLTVQDLDLALGEFRANDVPMAVSDTQGTGTTFLAHSHRVDPPVRFGPASAARHAKAGYRPAALPLAGLRSDLDTRADHARLAGPARTLAARRRAVARASTP
jgi:2-phospho-L-lactate guanylyltransferase